MVDMDRLFQIISQAKLLSSDQECVEAKNLLIITLNKHWLQFKQEINTDIKMPPKYHYFKYVGCQILTFSNGIC